MIIKFNYNGRHHEIDLREMVEKWRPEFCHSFTSNGEVFDVYYNEDYGDICVYWVDMDQEDDIGIPDTDCIHKEWIK